MVRPMTAILALAAPVDWVEAAASAADGPAPLPRFRMTAYTGGPMRLAGWRHPVVVDLAGLELSDQRLPIRLQHDAGLGVGHTDRLVVDAGQLLAEGVISRATPAAADVVASGRNGFPWQASIGASVEEHEFVQAGQSVTVNGRVFAGPVNVVRKAGLGEISFVDRGADSRTSASLAAAAAASLETDMDLSARCSAILAAHGEAWRPLVQEALIAGKSDIEVVAAIEAAAVKAERETAAAAAAALTAERDALQAQVAALTAERDALQAQVAAAAQGAPAPVTGAAAPLSLEEWQKLPPRERAQRRRELAH